MPLRAAPEPWDGAAGPQAPGSANAALKELNPIRPQGHKGGYGSAGGVQRRGLQPSPPTQRQQLSPHAEAAVEFLKIAAEETLKVFPLQNTAEIFQFSLQSKFCSLIGVTFQVCLTVLLPPLLPPVPCASHRPSAAVPMAEGVLSSCCQLGSLCPVPFTVFTVPAAISMGLCKHIILSFHNVISSTGDC